MMMMIYNKSKHDNNKWDITIDDKTVQQAFLKLKHALRTSQQKTQIKMFAVIIECGSSGGCYVQNTWRTSSAVASVLAY